VRGDCARTLVHLISVLGIGEASKPPFNDASAKRSKSRNRSSLQHISRHSRHVFPSTPFTITFALVCFSSVFEALVVKIYPWPGELRVVPSPQTSGSTCFCSALSSEHENFHLWSISCALRCAPQTVTTWHVDTVWIKSWTPRRQRSDLFPERVCDVILALHLKQFTCAY
jgi:hypothetical protein